MKKLQLLLFLTLCFWVFGMELQSPHTVNSLYFLEEPFQNLYFSNSTGGILNCGAAGTDPSPTVDWITQDGRSVLQMPGIIEVLVNGSLYFPPFSSHLYDTTVHDAMYTCKASSQIGVLLSKSVHVKAVIAGSYEVQVYDQIVAAGNTAVFRCAIPAFVSDFVTVTSWLHDSSFNIYPSMHGGLPLGRFRLCKHGKYHMTPSGELHVLNVGIQDSQSSFQCRTFHKLTSETQLSRTPARVIVTEPQGPTAPVISERASKLDALLGSSVFLPCVAQGNPPPSYSWFRGSYPVYVSSSSWFVGGSLALASVGTADAGEYTCFANNSAGSARYTTEFTVLTPLTAQVSPREVEVDAGRRLELRCHASGNPIDSVTWFKDGRQLRSHGRIRIRPRESLHLAPVEPSDAGIYQCLATSQHDSAYGYALVTLGATSPRLVYRFIAHTLQPGPAVSLKCIATGSPTPQITWNLDGFPIPQNHRYMMGQYVTAHGDVISHVNISSVRIDDGGAYQCIAKNEAGEVSHAGSLNIYGPPVVRPMGHMSAVAGETFYATCPVGGHPIHKIIWKKDGVRLPTSHRQKVYNNGTLEISHIMRDADGGMYSCTAEDKQGRSDTQTLTLSVMVAPVILPFHFETRLQSGDRVGIACIVSKGDPPIEIQWTKDNNTVEELPGVTVSSTTEFSSTLMISRLDAVHGGVYACTTSNKWASFTYSSELKVNVPPRLAPLVFPDDTRAGMRAQSTCLVQEGDQPITLTWFKDDQPLEFQEGITTSQINSFTSVLVIDKATAAVSGNYTCVATNAAKTTSSSASLTVSVPPTWAVEPRSVSVRLGGEAAIHCNAKGFPRPEVTWRKEKGSGEFVGLSVGNDPLIQTQPNGTLVLKRAEKVHGGRYLCEAHNGVGAGLSKAVTLRVNEPPQFKETNENVEVEVGSTATLICLPRGDKPITVTWYQGSVPLRMTARLTVSERESEDTGKTSELLLRDAQLQDSGTIICKAANEHGEASLAFIVVVQDVPPAPSQLMVSEEGSRYLMLSWTSVQSTSQITAYSVEYFPQKTKSREGFTREVTVKGAFNSVHIDGLLPATAYVFSVSAENRVGRSKPSSHFTYTTLEEAPGGFPGNIKVTGLSCKALQVNWEPPSEEESNGVVLGYYVGYRDESNSDVGGAYNFTTIGVDGIGVTTATLLDLRPNTPYAVIVQAFNSRGAGPPSPAVLGTTLEDRPSAPPGQVGCQALSSSSFRVSWVSPPTKAANGEVVSYRVSYEADPRHPEGTFFVGVPEALKSAIAEDTQLTITGLDSFTNYSVSVSASTRAGEGVSSFPVTCATLEDFPSAPYGVKALPSGQRSAIVSWAPPERPNGRITKYTVHWTPTRLKGRPHTRRVEPPSTHVILHDLSSGMYEIWVTASTSVGSGPESNIATLSPFRSIGAGIWSIGRNITVPWKEDLRLPCHTVGVPEPSVVWTHNGRQVESTNDERVAVLPDNTLRIMDTQRNHSGAYKCVATNKHSNNYVSYEINVIVPPSAPTIHVTETTSSSIRLQWIISDDGGAPVKHATLFFRAAGGETVEEILRGRKTSHTVSGLQCGTKYSFFSTLSNAVGTSSASTVVEASSKGRTPESPPQFQFVTANSSQATLYLSRWGSGGCPISRFAIQYKMMEHSQWTVVGNDIPASRTFLVPGLSGGKKFEFKVTAFNAAGSTSAQYIVVTPSEHLNRGFTVSVDTGMEDGYGIALWKDPRIFVPALISSLALVLTFITVVLCIKKRPLRSNTDRRTSGDVMNAALDNKARLIERENLYKTTRRLPASPPKIESSQGDFSEDDVYHYSSSTFQQGRLISPPPPAPSSPTSHEQSPGHPRAFSALVYESASLHTVDSPNVLVGGPRNAPRVHPMMGAFRGNEDDTEIYGSLAEGIDQGPSHSRQGAPRRQQRRFKNKQDSPKNAVPPRPVNPHIRQHWTDGHNSSVYFPSDAECDVGW